jgi:hypothetical protein
MAKHTPPRSQDNATISDAPAPPKARRSKSATPPAHASDTFGKFAGGGGAEGRGNEPNEEAIRARAYQRYLERGGTGGSDFDDWLEAERELKNSKP